MLASEKQTSKLPPIEVFFSSTMKQPAKPKQVVPRLVFPPSVVPPFVWDLDPDTDLKSNQAAVGAKRPQPFGRTTEEPGREDTKRAKADA